MVSLKTKFSLITYPYLHTLKILTTSSLSSAPSPFPFPPTSCLLPLMLPPCIQTSLILMAFLLLRSSYANALLAPTLPLISSYSSPTSSLPTTTSPSTHSITFRLKAQPWVPGWPPPTLISSWDPWRRTS